MRDDDKPMARRRFFREGLRELLKPLAGMAQPLEEAARQLSELERIGAADPYHSPAAPIPPTEHWLRPPGALSERQFLDTCSRCGECVRVCPAQCIKLDYSGGRGKGAPYIDPTEMPCVLCDGLACMATCPSGALQFTDRPDIDMGTAQWNEHLCVRSHGQECTLCVDNCPMGADALKLVDKRIVVNEDGCTGCGVCQKQCPTDPKSIVVMPKSARVEESHE